MRSSENTILLGSIMQIFLRFDRLSGRPARGNRIAVANRIARGNGIAEGSVGLGEGLVREAE